MNAGDSAVAVIGKSVQIRGEVRGSEDLMVDGHVEGTITLVDSRLTIGPNAHVSANVSAKDVILLGQLSGKVTAFLGPWILGALTYHFASQRIGMITIVVFFIIGAIILLRVKSVD